MDVGIKPPLPEAFLSRVGKQLGEALPAFYAAMEGSPVRGIRMNPAKAGRMPFRDAQRKIPWARDGWELASDSKAGSTIAHEAGQFYLQEPCAMLPGAVMDAKPGETILDLCAAPGGKSTQMGLDMRGKGLLICNEPVPKRAAVLSRNLERMGIPHGIVTRADPGKLAALWPEGFDGVLADVPCSGEGMFRRNPETRNEWTEEKAAGCVRRQREILESAARMVCPGGRLIYSTCTWNPDENEEQIETFLLGHPEFKPEGFRLPGIEAPEGMYTCWPHLVRGEGQFVARLRKRGSGSPRLEDGSDAFALSKECLRIWQTNGIGTERPNAAIGNMLTRIERIPVMKGIPVLRLGLCLGEVRGRIFIPDHAASMAITRPEMPEKELTDSEALRFLAGEPIPGGETGWVLMTWQGLVLGWGKGSEGTVKNHYPKGLRSEKLSV